ncbi:unnamed protein product [Bemisia tabaci]|uniref:Uncharacterized protein n=1 Tax=Bemisia tabaci TaxID=7038 RepID=A0A9P0AHA9_BEMTA|nr:unnamed protein product [Bemisia tabaci]
MLEVKKQLRKQCVMGLIVQMCGRGRKNGLCSVYFPYIVTLEEHADGLVIIRSNWISKERPNYCFYPTKVKDMTKYLQRRENVKPKTTQVENEETPQDEETPEDVVNT